MSRTSSRGIAVAAMVITALIAAVNTQNLKPTTFRDLENKAASESRRWTAARQRYTAEIYSMLGTLHGSRVGHGLVTTEVGGTTWGIDAVYVEADCRFDRSRADA